MAVTNPVTAHPTISPAARIRQLEDALLAVADELEDDGRGAEMVGIVAIVFGRLPIATALISLDVRRQVAAAAAGIRRSRAD